MVINNRLCNQVKTQQLWFKHVVQGMLLRLPQGKCFLAIRLETQ